ncbi:MAG TPA: hypothetical protein VGW38_08840 [Chloroflexota bacterium]|nr:hypothetical protein [Chloroflexota bacterium]
MSSNRFDVTRLRPVIVIVALVVLAVACAAGSGKTAEAKIEAALEKQPGLPVAVPLELPQHYEFDSVDLGQVDRRGAVIDSSWLYKQTEESRETEGELAVVEVCVVRQDVPSTCLDKSDALAVGRVGPYEAAVYSLGPGDPTQEWSRVEFTNEWRTADWVDT